jgi:hypothetical protein
MHSHSRNFIDKAAAKRYWQERAKLNAYVNLAEPKLPTNTDTSNLIPLTGAAGAPIPNDKQNLWKFLLVGDPESYPDGWELHDFKTNNNKWSSISLPNHWQLQGFDIPIYTNTSYPFQFDPPRARRNGLWVNQACDLGLGATADTYGPNNVR